MENSPAPVNQSSKKKGFLFLFLILLLPTILVLLLYQFGKNSYEVQNTKFKNTTLEGLAQAGKLADGSVTVIALPDTTNPARSCRLLDRMLFRMNQLPAQNQAKKFAFIPLTGGRKITGLCPEINWNDYKNFTHFALKSSAQDYAALAEKLSAAGVDSIGKTDVWVLAAPSGQVINAYKFSKESLMDTLLVEATILMQN